jgi:hypothetical protein
LDRQGLAYQGPVPVRRHSHQQEVNTKILYGLMDGWINGRRLKRHGNEADFLGFSDKSVRVGESTRLPIDTIFFKPLNKSMVMVHYIPGLFFAKLVL